MPLLVTGISEKPRYLKYVKPLPRTWRHDSVPWIIYSLFLEFITYLERMVRKTRKYC
jgi:hypothetical protein